MSDRPKSTAPTIEIPLELRGRCTAAVAGIRCTLREGHDGAHRTPAGDEWADPPADLPEPPELQPPPRIPTGHRSESVAVRFTFRAVLAPGAAALIDQAVEKAREVDTLPVDFPDAIEAAADDLAAVAAYLDWYADNRGDEIGRHEIKLAATVLDAAPAVADQAGILYAAARSARGGAPGVTP